MKELNITITPVSASGVGNLLMLTLTDCLTEQKLYKVNLPKK